MFLAGSNPHSTNPDDLYFPYENTRSILEVSLEVVEEGK